MSKNHINRGAASVGVTLTPAQLEMLAARVQARGALESIKNYAYTVGRNHAISSLRAETAAARRNLRNALRLLKAQLQEARRLRGFEELRSAQKEFFGGYQGRYGDEYAAKFALLQLFLEGLAPAQLAREFGISRTNVHQRVRRARLALLPYLGEAGRELLASRMWKEGL